MKLTEVHPNRLYDPAQRVCAKLARIARVDAWNGGAKALCMVNRLELSPYHAEYLAAVTQAYHSLTGTASNYLAYECPECGSACMGEDAVYECCWGLKFLLSFPE